MEVLQQIHQMEPRFDPHERGDLPQLQVEIHQECLLPRNAMELDPHVHSHRGAARPPLGAEERQNLALRPAGPVASLQPELPHDTVQGFRQLLVARSPVDHLGHTGPHRLQQLPLRELRAINQDPHSGVGAGKDPRQADSVIGIGTQIQEEEVWVVVLERRVRFPEERRGFRIRLEPHFHPPIRGGHQLIHPGPEAVVDRDQRRPHLFPSHLAVHSRLFPIPWARHRISLSRLIRDPVRVPPRCPEPAPAT
jgi:hypothetical protein